MFQLAGKSDRPKWRTFKDQVLLPAHHERGEWTLVANAADCVHSVIVQEFSRILIERRIQNGARNCAISRNLRILLNPKKYKAHISGGLIHALSNDISPSLTFAAAILKMASVHTNVINHVEQYLLCVCISVWIAISIYINLTFVYYCYGHFNGSTLQTISYLLSTFRFT